MRFKLKIPKIEVGDIQTEFEDMELRFGMSRIEAKDTQDWGWIYLALTLKAPKMKVRDIQGQGQGCLILRASVKDIWDQC